VPWDSGRFMIVARFGMEGHRSEIPPTGHARADADLAAFRGRRFGAAWTTAARGSRSTAPWDISRFMIAARFGMEGHGSEMPPTVRVRAGTALALHGQRRRAGRGTRCQGSGWKDTAQRSRTPVAPILHYMVSGSARIEEHSAVGKHMRQDCAKVPVEWSRSRDASYWSRSRRQRSYTAWAAAARGSWNTEPGDSVCTTVGAKGSGWMATFCLASYWTYSRGHRSHLTWTAAARGSSSTVPMDSVCILCVPMSGRTDTGQSRLLLVMFAQAPILHYMGSVGAR